jgi:copper chaperone
MKLFNFKNKTPQTFSLNVKGMTCGHCTGKVEKFVSDLKGVESVHADLQSGVVTVVGVVELQEIRECIERLGYEIQNF